LEQVALARQQEPMALKAAILFLVRLPQQAAEQVRSIRRLRRVKQMEVQVVVLAVQALPESLVLETLRQSARPKVITARMVLPQ
jgi:hypothetical protein